MIALFFITPNQAFWKLCTSQEDVARVIAAYRAQQQEFTCSTFAGIQQVKSPSDFEALFD